jgi:hypothetical protein
VQDAGVRPAGRQGGRKRPAQAGAAQHDLFDDAAFEVRRDAAPGDFYFWEFRHLNDMQLKYWRDRVWLQRNIWLH